MIRAPSQAAGKGGRKRLKRPPPVQGHPKRLKRRGEPPKPKSEAPDRPRWRKPSKRRLSDWLLVRTHAHRERYAKRNIERQGHRAFLPDFQQEGSQRVEILFPGYLFVLMDRSGWEYLRSTYGCVGPVLFGDQPALMPLKEIRRLLKMCDREGTLIVHSEQFKEGQPVKIKKGPFQNHVGVYIGGAANRVAVLFQMLGGGHELEFRKADITGSLTEKELASLRGPVR